VEVSVFDRRRAGSHTVPSGYSYKSSQYGLTIDNIAGYELVLPNGTVTYVTSKDKDLWFGLRVSGKLGTYR
jgi:FAD/FMN-containing dehydrogenase